jgi:hypothetical protein
VQLAGGLSDHGLDLGHLFKLNPDCLRLGIRLPPEKRDSWVDGALLTMSSTPPFRKILKQYAENLSYAQTC